MNDIGLFIAGVVITIPAFGGIALLLYAAVLDGRENARLQAERRREDRPERSADGTAKRE